MRSSRSYGATWCPDCKRAKKFLGEQRVHYNWVDIEQNAEGQSFVERINHGKRIIPTIVFDDGGVLVEPSNAELAAKLGLQTHARMNYYDVIIVGGGPTGLTTALYAAREGLDVLVIEKSGLGGQAGVTERLDNFPGFPDGIAGADFADRLAQQARRFGVEILQAQQVTSLRGEEESRYITTADGNEYGARAILVATGSTYRRLGVPGEDDLIGAGVHFCATCDGPFYKGQHIAVIGGGQRMIEIPGDRILLGFVLGNKVAVGSVNANRVNFERGVQDMALAETQYPGWLSRLLTHRVRGLDNYAEMMRLLIEEKSAIKVYVEIDHSE